MIHVVRISSLTHFPGLGLVGEVMVGIIDGFRNARSRLSNHFLSEYWHSLLSVVAVQFSTAKVLLYLTRPSQVCSCKL